MNLFALLAALAGCSRKLPPPPPAPTVADLHFPVVGLFPTAACLLYKNAADLGVMHMNLLMDYSSSPILIDSEFNIYTMEKLASTHGGLWLMAHPSGTTEVTFELKRAPKSGMEAARDTIRAQLDIQTWRDDLEKRRKKLVTETTLAGMLKIVEVEDTIQPPP
jgi:hypothetical protein